MTCRRGHLSNGLSVREIAGFTLVEMAMVLVVGGLLLAMTAKGFTVLENSKADQLVQQVRQFEMLMKEHLRARQRWPGDCDGNGLIDASLFDSAPASGDKAADRTARAGRYDYTASIPSASNEPPDPVTTVLGNGCPVQLTSTWSGSTDINVPFNDLKLAGLLSAAQPNRIAAAHAAGDFLSLVQIHLNPSSGGIDRDFNAIVFFNVPVSFVRRLAIAIDGFDGDTAYKGRVRRLDITTSTTDFRFKDNWQGVGESPDSMVTVAYFFDQLPLAQSYQSSQTDQ